MGLGFVCVVPESDAERATALLAGHHPGARQVGVVTGDAGVVSRR
jgi:phosphoribosylformylglycinamidine cyclo-ligase